VRVFCGHDIVLHLSCLACPIGPWGIHRVWKDCLHKHRKCFLALREQTKMLLCACYGPKEGINAVLEICTCCIGPRAPWETVAMSASRQEHGHGKVGTRKIVIGCGHMHGQHVTIEHTQVHKVLWRNRSVIGQGGKAGGRPYCGLAVGSHCHERGGEFGYLKHIKACLVKCR
jgi:hypothetical protein